jgi:hypothetical protein
MALESAFDNALIYIELQYQYVVNARADKILKNNRT